MASRRVRAIVAAVFAASALLLVPAAGETRSGARSADEQRSSQPLAGDAGQQRADDTGGRGRGEETPRRCKPPDDGKQKDKQDKDAKECASE